MDTLTNPEYVPHANTLHARHPARHPDLRRVVPAHLHCANAVDRPKPGRAQHRLHSPRGRHHEREHRTAVAERGGEHERARRESALRSRHGQPRHGAGRHVRGPRLSPLQRVLPRHPLRVSPHIRRRVRTCQDGKHLPPVRGRRHRMAHRRAGVPAARSRPAMGQRHHRVPPRPARPHAHPQPRVQRRDPVRKPSRPQLEAWGFRNRPQTPREPTTARRLG